MNRITQALKRFDVDNVPVACGSDARPAKRTGPRHGFTVVELMVATTVMSIALLGVHSIFHHALDSEAAATVRWNQAASAQTVVEHLAQALRQCVNVPGLQALSAGTDAAGARVLVCVVSSGWEAGPTIERRRYRWNDPADEQDGTLRMKRLLYCGSALGTPLCGATDAAAPDDAQLWLAVPGHVVATRLDELSVQIRVRDDAGGAWQVDWVGRSGNVVLKVHARVGAESAQQFIVPPCNEDLFVDQG